MTIRKHSQNTVTRSEFTCVRDGLVIRGTQLRPVGVKLPAVILSHGFNGNRKGVLKYAEVVARWGYTAFCFDFCGGGPDTESDGQTYDMTVFSEKEDLKAVLQYVKSLAYVDSSRIILMGFSQGGFVSALAAAELPEQVAKLVLFYPALCIPDDARRGRMMQASFSPEHIPDLIPVWLHGPGTRLSCLSAGHGTLQGGLYLSRPHSDPSRHGGYLRSSLLFQAGSGTLSGLSAAFDHRRRPPL